MQGFTVYFDSEDDMNFILDNTDGCPTIDEYGFDPLLKQWFVVYGDFN